MDPFEGLGDHRTHAQQRGALGRPVARRARSVLLAAEHDQRDAGLLVVLRGVVDEGLRPAILGEVTGVTTGDVVEQLVAQPDVGEGSADHHLVVAAPRSVGVEVLLFDAVGLQVLRRRCALLDAARRRDVVCGDRIAKQGQHSGALDVGDGLRLGGHAVEVRRLAHIRRVRIPLEGLAFGGGQVAPPLVALEDVGVVLGEHLLVDRRGDGVGDVLGRGPDVLEEDVVAVGVLAQRIGLEVEVHGSGQCIGDHQRRGGEVVHLHIGGDAAFEVTVARQHRGHGEVFVVDGLGDLLRQRTGVADARGAAVSDEIEAQLLQVRPQAGLVVVVADHLGAGRHRGLDPRLGRQAFLDGVTGQQRRAQHHRRVGGVGAGGDGCDDHRTVIEDELAAVGGGHLDRLGGTTLGTVGRRCHVDGVVVGEGQ